MWICETCNNKNNNSSEFCHGINCNAPRPKGALKEDTKCIDRCPNCRTDTAFTFRRKRGKKKQWSCDECHKLCWDKGKKGRREYVKEGPIDPITS